MNTQHALIRNTANPAVFSVKPFRNRNGTTSFRVSGWLLGERIRKNFKTREAAIIERGTLLLKQAQTNSSLRVVSTFLSDAQLREAEAAFHKIKDLPRPLSFYLDFALSNYREAKTDTTVEDAVKAYLAERGNDVKQSIISQQQWDSIDWELSVFKEFFKEKTLAELTTARLLDYIRRGKALLTTDDMAVLRDQLRALGLPEATVKEIVKARIASRYTAALRDIGNEALSAARQHPYWRGKQDYTGGLIGYSSEQRLKMREIDREKENEAIRLFGTDKTSDAASYYAFLTPEKSIQLNRLEGDYYDLWAQTAKEMAGFPMPGDKEKFQLIDDEKKRDMLALLTPEEKQANDLRNSDTARGLQRTFAGFNGTEEEYKAIFALRYPLEEKFPNEVTRIEAIYGNDISAYYKARGDAQKTIDAQIKDMLGDDRYADYQRAQRQDYQSLQAAAERFNLSADTVAQTYQARTDAANEAKRISDDKTLSTDQKNAAYAALAEQATAQIKASLGDEVGDAYINNALDWLKNLPKGGTVTIDSKGNVKVTQPKPTPPAP